MAVEKKTGKMSASSFVSRQELVDFLNDLLHLKLTKIEETSSGAIACQIIELIFPGAIPLHRINWDAKLDFQRINNYRLLQVAFRNNGIDRNINCVNLTNGKYKDILEFNQWLKAFFERHSPLDRLSSSDYDPAAVRVKGKGGAQFNKKYGVEVSCSKRKLSRKMVESPTKTCETQNFPQQIIEIRDSVTSGFPNEAGNPANINGTSPGISFSEPNKRVSSSNKSSGDSSPDTTIPATTSVTNPGNTPKASISFAETTKATARTNISQKFLSPLSNPLLPERMAPPPPARSCRSLPGGTRSTSSFASSGPRKLSKKERSGQHNHFYRRLAGYPFMRLMAFLLLICAGTLWVGSAGVSETLPLLMLKGPTLDAATKNTSGEESSKVGSFRGSTPAKGAIAQAVKLENKSPRTDTRKAASSEGKVRQVDESAKVSNTARPSRKEGQLHAKEASATVDRKSKEANEPRNPAAVKKAVARKEPKANGDSHASRALKK
mmetsp:Transcript_29842/g.62376  ORF Transcript_29842/g.62376 Transcript_29842/m.62376 type:complete len:493 (-) Transcript_29842:116-1594(-)